MPPPPEFSPNAPPPSSEVPPVSLDPSQLPRLRTVSLTVLMILGVLYTLYFARALILPLVLALLLSQLLTPLVRTLERRLRIPTPAGAGVVLLGLLAGITLAGLFTVPPAMAWMQTIPTRIPEIKYQLRFLERPFARLSEASEQVKEMTIMGGDSAERVVRVSDDAWSGLLMQQTPAYIANIFVMFILLFFLLASGDTFLRKFVRLVPRFEDKRRAVEIAHEIEHRISNYLRAVTLINIGLGIAIGISAWLVGLENFILWGVLAFVLNYIPYVGALIGTVATLLVGLLTFESPGWAFVMPAIYVLFNVIEGNFITPLVMSRTLILNPVLVFFSIMFWAWLWGIPGALLAVPILATFKIICDHIDELVPIGEFLGDESRPT